MMHILNVLLYILLALLGLIFVSQIVLGFMTEHKAKNAGTVLGLFMSIVIMCLAVFLVPVFAVRALIQKAKKEQGN